MKKYLSSFILLLAAVLWGLAFVAQKEASAVPAFAVGAVRGALAVIFLLIAIPLSDLLTKSPRRLISSRGIDFKRREIIGGALSGAFLFLASALQQLAIGVSDAGKASFITALYVVIVPLYGLLFGKRAPLSVWLAVAISVLGFYLISMSGAAGLESGDLLLLGCAFVFAIQITAIDAFLPGCDPLRFSCMQFFTSFILSLICALIFEGGLDFSLIGAHMPSLIYLGIVSSGIAYTCQIIGQKDTPPAVASLLLSLESVFGALFAALIIGERLSVREYIGCAVVFAAVILAELDIPALFKRHEKNN